MSKRRAFPPEFKREAVELSRTPGVTIKQIADELGIGANMLSRWRKELDRDGTKVKNSGTGTKSKMKCQEMLQIGAIRTCI